MVGLDYTSEFKTESPQEKSNSSSGTWRATFQSMWLKCNLSTVLGLNLIQHSPEETYMEAFLKLFNFRKFGFVHLEPLNDYQPYPSTDPRFHQELTIADINHLKRGRFNLTFDTDSVNISFHDNLEKEKSQFSRCS